MRDFFQRLKYRFAIFMQGRYGMDQLGKAMNTAAIILLIVSVFTKWQWSYFAAIILIVLLYARVFSKKLDKRYKENQRFINFRTDWKRKREQKKIYRFYKCPKCKQKVRVPKGRGKICITCPKCRTEFIRHS